MTRLAVVLGIVTLTGCYQPPVQVGVTGQEVEPKTPAVCIWQCQQMGLVLDSVVLISGRAGCVCAVPSPAATPAEPGPVRPNPAAPAPAAPASAHHGRRSLPLIGAILDDDEAAAAAAAAQQQQQQHHH